MTRQLFNYGPEPQYYRQSSHPVNVPVFSRANPRTDPLAGTRQQTRSFHNTTPIPALPGHDGNGPPRRRIPVACARCRKRKIRCSGDPGDSTGCNNCKQAGIPHGVCVFLRVSSSNIDLSPYSSSSSASSSSSSLGMGLSHASVSTPALHGSVRLGGQSFVKSMYHQSDVENSSLVLAGRSTYDSLSVDMGTNASVVTTGGDMLIPPYMLPDASHGVGDNSTLLHGHGQPDIMRQWTPLGSGPPSRTAYGDPDASASYMTTGSRATNTTNTPVDYAPGNFPALGLLSSSLPDSIGSRGNLIDTKPVLPLPIRTQSADVNRGSTNNGLNSDIASSQVSSGNYKQYWVSDTSALPGPRGSSSQQSTSTSILRMHSPVNSYNPSNSSGYPNSSVMLLGSNNMHSASGDRLTTDPTTGSKIRTNSATSTTYPQRTRGSSKVY